MSMGELGAGVLGTKCVCVGGLNKGIWGADVWAGHGAGVLGKEV